MLERALRLPRPATASFFLWGPRQTGKSSLLRATYPDAFTVDLLNARELVRFTTDPQLLREEVAAAGARFVVLDEVQKAPALLDEVHWLIENRGVVFALCGSSARKVRRGHANLLGGRALRYELHGLVSAEVGEPFDVLRSLNVGYLPRHYLAEDASGFVRAYVDDYLKEEVMAEGLTRNLPAFSQFLTAAALADGQLVNYSTIARDCGVSPYATREYFQILVDTLLGTLLPAYRKRPKRRVVQTPKFYFSDVGMVNHLARRGTLAPGTELIGAAFENWVFHELAAYRAYRRPALQLSFWRLAGGTEVDFVVDDFRLALEAKATRRVHTDHLKGLREVAVDHRVQRRAVVSFDARPRRTDDGIEVLPWRTFAARLWDDDLIVA